VLNQNRQNAAQAMRSGAAYACARGLWRMPAGLAVNSFAVVNGKSRVHHVQAHAAIKAYA
jgi:hypothetical protein